MQYMMMVCYDDTFVPLDDMEAATEKWVADTTARGVRLSGHQLAPTTAATTVRVRGGEVLLSDGPFAEAKEQMAGYDLLECTDLDEAIEVAAAHPMARAGLIEVRPFWTD